MAVSHQGPSAGTGAAIRETGQSKALGVKERWDCSHTWSEKIKMPEVRELLDSVLRLLIPSKSQLSKGRTTDTQRE